MDIGSRAIRDDRLASRSLVRLRGDHSRGYGRHAESRLLLVGRTPSLVGAILGADVAGARRRSWRRRTTRLPAEPLICSWRISPAASIPASCAGADGLIRGPIHGKEGVRASLQDWIDMFDGFWMELVELIDAGGVTVFTAERYGGRARLSGVETVSANWTVFTIRDEKIPRRPRVPDP